MHGLDQPETFSEGPLPGTADSGIQMPPRARCSASTGLPRANSGAQWSGSRCYSLIFRGVRNCPRMRSVQRVRLRTGGTMIRLLTRTAVFAVGLLLGAASYAQTSQPNAPSAAKDTLNQEDKTFVKEAGIGGIAEVELRK